jgi:hypothetical protein
MTTTEPAKEPKILSRTWLVAIIFCIAIGASFLGGAYYAAYVSGVGNEQIVPMNAAKPDHCINQEGNCNLGCKIGTWFLPESVYNSCMNSCLKGECKWW